jgi:SAM-dependent methyltransferase
MIDTFRCVLCDATTLDLVAGFEQLPRVTSDCKPWPSGGSLAVCARCGTIQKPLQTTWLADIDRIYADYDIFHLSDTPDQLVFGAGLPRPRTSILVDFVLGHANLPSVGDLLDVGCGKGAALANFAASLPGWKLYANELSDKTLPALQCIPGFSRLYVGDVAAITERFSLVSLIHVLEHIINPLQAMRDIRSRIADGGVLLVEVPDAETSPFDLLVADHRSHFTGATLQALARRAGFAVSAFSDTLVAKELTLLARPEMPQCTGATDPLAGWRAASATVRWLGAVVATLERLVQQGPVGIFGTAVSSMALYGAVRDRVTCFVDEDVGRQGKRFDGKPIVSPAQVESGTTVFLPLVPAIAAKVASRLRKLTSLHIVEPPPFHRFTT